MTISRPCLNNAYKNKEVLISKINKSRRQLSLYMPSAYKTEDKAPSKIDPLVHRSVKSPLEEKLTACNNQELCRRS